MTNISIQLQNIATYYDFRWRHQGSDQQKKYKNPDDDTRSFDKIHVGDFHSLCGSDSKYYRYSENQNTVNKIVCAYLNQ